MAHTNTEWFIVFVFLKRRWLWLRFLQCGILQNMVEVRVPNLDCEGCASKLKKALFKLKGKFCSSYLDIPFFNFDFLPAMGRTFTHGPQEPFLGLILACHLGRYSWNSMCIPHLLWLMQHHKHAMYLGLCSTVSQVHVDFLFGLYMSLFAVF